MRTVTCENHLGFSSTFGLEGFSPFILAHIDGAYEASNNVYMTQNTMSDGGTYQGSTAKIRNIVLTLMDRPEMMYRQNSRDLLYNLFPKDTRGTLTYTEDESVRQIDYYVERVWEGETEKRLYFVSLLCDDPLFRSPYDVKIEMANWVGGFEFIHEFIEEGEEIGWREAATIKDVFIENAADNIGLTIHMYCEGEVRNPVITRVENDTHMRLGSSAKPLLLHFGDLITITTGKNDKHVYLKRNGVETEINAYLTEDSDYIQLRRGHNNIGYEAEQGEEYLVVEVSYLLRFEGA